MADDAPQDTTITQDTPATDVSTETSVKVDQLVQEAQTTETPSEEKQTPTEKPKTETVPETPQTPEPPKEETKQEEKVSSSPESETPKPPQLPQINLDELRAKANKERQDRKQEHLSEVEKLAKSKQINNNDVRELLHVSQSTATNYLEELTKQGKLKKSGKAKDTTYSS